MENPPTITVDALIDEFADFDSWEERYRAILDFADELPPLDPGEKTPETKVQGCQSQVWLVAATDGRSPPHLTFAADSDAAIVRGLVAILVMLYSGKTPREIVGLDIERVFEALGLGKHLTPARSNGLRSMVRRIQELAVLAEAAASRGG